jgi:DNA-binding LacI/PurR family transcriptional regulator
MTVTRVTSADVARLAGVSRATVSYVLNDTPRQSISADTRNRVLDAAARLGYAPSAAARALRTGRSDVVLCLLPDWPIGSEVGALLGCLSTALAREGLTFVVHPGNREDRPISEIWKALTPAAVIAFDDFSDAEMTAMRAAGVALVVALLGGSGRAAAGSAVSAVAGAVSADAAPAAVSARTGAVSAIAAPASSTAAVQGREGAAAGVGMSGVGVASGRQGVAVSGRVGLDVLGRAGMRDLTTGNAFRAASAAGAGRSLDMPQELIGRRQAEHLVAAGHTRLGYAAPDDSRLRIFVEPRLAGVRAVCQAGGRPDPVIETVALDATKAADAVRRWHAAGVTAICAYNDEVALAVLAGIRAADTASPALAPRVCLAVIGADDIPAARLATPALTTVTTDQSALAAHLAATVVAAVSGQTAPALPAADLVRVIVRKSA